MAVIAVIVAVVAVLLSTDFNQYRGLVAEEAKAATGRDLVISGNLDLNLSLTPSLSVQGVTLANAAWGSRPEMVKLGSFEAELELLPLIKGDIQINRVRLTGLDVLLETDKKGRPNWLLGGGASPAPEKASSGDQKGPPPFPWCVTSASKMSN
ncbi:MAG: AsmA family protein [Rhodospirillales bacterium]|nr:AsmA family protein [Rhodospirillales bacterium]